MSNVVRREGGQMRRAMATPPGPFAMQELVAAVAKVCLDRFGLNLLFRRPVDETLRNDYSYYAYLV